jgi:hypothetical protein
LARGGQVVKAAVRQKLFNSIAVQVVMRIL